MDNKIPKALNWWQVMSWVEFRDEKPVLSCQEGKWAYIEYQERKVPRKYSEPEMDVLERAREALSLEISGRPAPERGKEYSFVGSDGEKMVGDESWPERVCTQDEAREELLQTLRVGDLVARLTGQERELNSEAWEEGAWHRLDRSAVRFERDEVLERWKAQSSSAASCAPRPATLPENYLIKEGAAWRIRFEGRRERLVGRLTGMSYIAELLRKPGVEILSLDLWAQNNPTYDSCSDDEKVAADKYSRSPDIDQEGEIEAEVSDPKTLKALQNRVEEIEGRLQAPLLKRDKREDLESERDGCKDYILRAMNIKGEIRRFSGKAENARTAVSRAIDGAISTIRKNDASMATHLDKQIKKGKGCCYREGSGKIKWFIST